MLAFGFILITILFGSYSYVIENEKPAGESAGEASLVLTHVLFRHGNRTPELSEVYPKDPYLNETFFPFGRGQLTNAGKRREYSIGTALRERYGAFLGPYYYPDIIQPRSTDRNRTKMSLELVLASLFPPTGVEIWKNSFNWQPVPYTYVPEEDDDILYGISCPTYKTLYAEVTNSSKVQAEYHKHQKEFDYISRNSGLNVTTFENVYDLFFGLATEEEWGFKLPNWTKKVWPDIVTDLAIRQYFIYTQTTDLRKMAAGYLIKKIITDSQSKIKSLNETHGVKMYLYSAHENTVAQLLITLDLFNHPHVPTYGSYVVVELHHINNVFGFKILYQNYTTNEIQLLKLPGCDTFCPLGKFRKLVEEYIPSDDFCGN